MIRKQLTILIFTLLLPYATHSQGLSHSDVVIILGEGDYNIKGKLISTVKQRKITDSLCSFQEAMTQLKQDAKEKGANLVVITKLRTPFLKNCYLFNAELYKVKDPKKYESAITWSKDKILEWSDYYTLDLDSVTDIKSINSGCLMHISYTAYANSAPIIHSVDAVFYKNISWVTAGYKSDALLNHERKRFDACKIYALVLYKKLTTDPFRFSASRVNFLIDSVRKDYESTMKLYDKETDYVKNVAKQKEWDILIDAKLNELLEASTNN